MNNEERKVADEFHDVVNMTPKEIEKWLETDESKGVGQKASDGSESTGHQSGRRIIEILNKKKDDLGDDDFAHMQKVHGYVARHLKQKPSGDVSDTPWGFSLMNWGHDPLK